MAGSTTISPHNAFKDPVDTDPFLDSACSSVTDATDSFLGNATAGTVALLLVILKLRWMDVLESLSLALKFV